MAAFLLVFVSILAGSSSALFLNGIGDIVQFFKLSDTSIFVENFGTRFHLLKELNAHNVSVKTLANLDVLSAGFEGTLIIASISTFPMPIPGLHNTSFVRYPLLIMTGNVQSWRDELTLKVAINQRVFVIDHNSMDFFEIYSINQNTIWTRLGKIENGTQKFDTNVNPALVERRLNFQEIHLNVIMDEQVPFNEFPANFEGIAKYHESNDTHEVTNLVKGTFQTTLDNMADRMNFTYSLFVRRDRYWASPITDENGNTYWKGMVENLMDGSAQLASASLTITPARATAMDYLPPLGTEKYQLILKSSNIEDVSWRTYGMQFRVELWSVIFAMVFCFWILILMSEWLLDKTFTLPSPAKLFGTLWFCLAANIGWKPHKPPDASSPLTLRYLSTLALLIGTLITTGYKASLTAELAVRRTWLPFDSLESLLKSEYMLFTNAGTVMQTHFLKAPNGSIHKQILDSGTKKFTFTDQDLDEVLEEPKMVYYGPMETLDECGKISAWESGHPGLLAMAVPKHSPYKIFFDRFIMKMQETGPIRKINLQSKKERMASCGEKPLKTGKKITLEKIFTLYMMLGLGFTVAFAIMILELILSRTLRKPGINKKQHLLQPFVLEALQARKSMEKVKFDLHPTKWNVLQPLETIIELVESMQYQ